MSKQYPGGLITKSPVTPSGPYLSDTASGIWTLDQQAYWQKLGQWPTAGNYPKDAQFNYVTMLLHGDGTNGAQNNTFLDSSTNNFTITRNGNTTQGSFSPYGSNWSNNFNGSSYLTGPTTNSAFDFGSGDWTIETWAYPTAFSNQMSVFISLDNATASSYAIGLLINTNGSVQVYQYGGSYFINSTSSTGVVTLNTWSHIAAVRSGSTFAIFVNGTRVASVSSVSGTQAANKTVNIGQDPYANNLRFSGYLSNLRVVKGTAVYSPSSSTITVPTTPLTAISGTSLLTCQSNRFIDNSTNAFAITVNGTPSVQRFNPFGASTAYSTSVIGGSGYFDGSGDYLTIANNVAFKFGTGDYTIEFWLFYNAYGTFATSIRTDGASPQWVLQSDSGVMNYYVNGSVILAESSAPSLSSWNHYAVVRSGSGTNNTKMYRNGVQVAQATNNTDIQPTSQVVIGSGGDSNIASFGLNGYLSNIRVVKGTAVYTAAFTPPTAPLTAITNTSLLTNFTNGAIFDNAMMNDLETVGNAQISTSVKKYGTGSLAFDGTGDRLVSPPTYLFDLAGDFTIECWANFNTLAGTYTGIASYADSSGWYGWQLIKNNSNIQFQFLSASAGVGTVTSSSTVTTGVWYHIAVVRSGSTITLYIDGTSRGTSTSSASYSSANSFFRVGDERTLSYPLDGYVDDLRITKGYARYTANFTPPTTAFPDIGPT